MAFYQLAAVIKNSSDEDFLLVRQAPPPPLPEEEYLSYFDSDLWDLPSAPLNPLEGDSRSGGSLIEGADLFSGKLDLRRFDVDSALDLVLTQVSLVETFSPKWSFWKNVEEPEFGPGPLLNTIFLLGELDTKEVTSQESCQWFSNLSAMNLLREVKPSADRIGPLLFIGLLKDLNETTKFRLPSKLECQEYPPGIMVLPMKSSTLKPFHTTNLVVVFPADPTSISESNSFAYGDALLVDPGCSSKFHVQLEEVVTALPKKLLVFVTHHHYDHIEGLSVIVKHNPEAIILAHQNTISRIGKGWSLKCTVISGGENICIGGEDFEVISAPGHTDGHLALLHKSTNSLIVGDHCVGQGSSVLDSRAGGNIKDYFNTTYRFLELSPHVLIPMHGRMNLWPKRMLCRYLKHRRDRESSILKAIENGSQTIFDIISNSYGDLDTKLWFPASLNVTLHVDHLAYREKLPKIQHLDRVLRDNIFVALCNRCNVSPFTLNCCTLILI